MSRDPKQDKFVKSILNTILRSAISRTMWGLPLPVVIGIAVLAAGAIWYFNLY
jgi:hypothetical protein